MASLPRGERRNSFSGAAPQGGSNAIHKPSRGNLFIVGAAPGQGGVNSSNQPHLQQHSAQSSHPKSGGKVQAKAPPAWLSGRKKQSDIVEKHDSPSSFNALPAGKSRNFETDRSLHWTSAKVNQDDELRVSAVQKSGRYANMSAFVDFDSDSPLRSDVTSSLASEDTVVSDSRAEWRTRLESSRSENGDVFTLSSSSKLRLTELRRTVAARRIQQWWSKVRGKCGQQADGEESCATDGVSMERLFEARKRAAQSIRASNTDFVGELRAAQRNATEERAREQRRRAIEALHEQREAQRNKESQLVNAELTRIAANQKQSAKSTVKQKHNDAEEKQSVDQSQTSDAVSVAMATAESGNSLQPKSTLDDLLDTLRLIEQETSTERKSSVSGFPMLSSSSYSSKIVGELDALIAETEQTKVNLNSSFRSLTQKPLATFEPLPKGKKSDPVKANGMQVEDARKRAASSSKPPSSRRTDRSKPVERSKLNSHRSEAESGSETQRSESQDLSVAAIWNSPATLDMQLDVLAERERAAKTASAISEKLLTSQLELDERTRECEALKRALNFQRELTVRNAAEAQRDAERQLNAAKRELDETNKRHVTFIDQLIEDKKNLADRCETLVRELRTIEQRAADRFRVLEERHATEMRKLKEVHEAAEKLRREKWIDEQTKRIKQLTVKGLEPEIEKLVTRHKEELRRLRAEHEAALADADQRASERFQQTLSENRLQFERERNDAVERERRLAAERADKQVREELDAVAKQRDRLSAEASAERDRLEDAVAKQRAELERERGELQKAHSEALATLKKEFEAARVDLDARAKREMEVVRARLDTEQRAFLESELRKKEADFAKREAELKERFRAERDREIEMAIERLERDSASVKSETERIAEQKYKRLREKYDAEIREMEDAAKQSSAKSSELKSRCAELESENDRLKVMLRQREKETEDVRKMFDTLNREREHVGDIVRQEFADRIVQCEEDNKRLKAEMSELRAKHSHELAEAKKELENLQRVKEREFEEIHQRVKLAISKKDDVVNQLRKEYEQAVKRADHLEELLTEQRQAIVQNKK